MTEDKMTPAQSVSAAAWRALHSYWTDTLVDQAPEVGQRILASMGGDGRFDSFVAHVLEADGVWRLLRIPAAEPWADMYELRLRTPSGLIPFTRVTGERLGLYDAVLTDVEVELDDAGIAAWLDSEPGTDNRTGGVG